MVVGHNLTAINANRNFNTVVCKQKKDTEKLSSGYKINRAADDALNEVHDMLQRANELAIKAATGTLQDSDRMMIDAEIQQLKAEIDSTARNTTFNEISIFPENGHSPLATSYMESKAFDIKLDLKNGTFQINDAQAGQLSMSPAAVSLRTP